MKNKVIIITGASSGIGKALAQHLSQKGAILVLAARQEDALKELASSLKTDTLIVKTDVTIKEDCQNLVDKTIEKYGKIDVLINNAGISMRAMFNDCELEVIEKLMDVNFFGAVYCTKFALPYILKSKGSIVGVSSIAGFRGLPARTGYSASKFALNGFLESLRTELLHEGVHVLTACPGFTASNIRNVALTQDGTSQAESPLEESKIMSAEEVATYIVHAIENRTRTLVLTGQGKLTVWMNKLFPKWMDKMVFNHFAKEPNSPLKKK